MPHKQGQKADNIYVLSVGWQNEFKTVISDVGDPEEILGIILFNINEH